MRYGFQRGFTLVELAVVIVIVVIVGALIIPSLGRARPSEVGVYCASNQGQFVKATLIYAQDYGTFPPHNPLPGYWPDDPMVRLHGAAFDPSLGWLMTYGIRMKPPETFANGHFKWYVLSEEEIPDIVICPAARREVMFEPNPEIDPIAPWETFIYQYAAFYQVNGIVRSGTPVLREALEGEPSIGGYNPAVPDFSNPAGARQALNAVRRMPSIRVRREIPAHDWAGAPLRSESVEYWVQARQPSDVNDPKQLYYIADSREYRPADDHLPGSELPGTTNDGWLATGDGKVVLGSRHDGLRGADDRNAANVGYLDGHVSREGCVNDPSWKMNYDSRTGAGNSKDWRASTFSDTASMPGLGNQHHLMPAIPEQ